MRTERVQRSYGWWWRVWTWSHSMNCYFRSQIAFSFWFNWKVCCRFAHMTAVQFTLLQTKSQPSTEATSSMGSIRTRYEFSIGRVSGQFAPNSSMLCKAHRTVEIANEKTSLVVASLLFGLALFDDFSRALGLFRSPACVRVSICKSITTTPNENNRNVNRNSHWKKCSREKLLWIVRTLRALKL